MFINNFDPVAFQIFSFEIRWYSLAYIFGIIFGWLYCKKKLIKDEKLLNLFDDLIAYLIIGIILGGRLGYIIFYNLEYYLDNFFEILMIWNGGMSFHGGLIGVILATVIFSKKHKINSYIFLDLIALVAPIGLFLGRIANFINGELYGKISTLPWAIIFSNGGSVARHPSQIYEAILEGIILFILINYLALKKQLLFKTGYISGFFLVSYSILRIFSENFREPDMHLGYFFNYFSMGVILSFITFLAGCFIIFFIKNNEQNN